MKAKSIIFAVLAAAALLATASCKKDAPVMQATVTVKTLAPSNECVLQLDDQTILKPENISKSPFKKEVRAMIYYTDKGALEAPAGSTCQWRLANVVNMNDILTKDPAEPGSTYSTAGVEIYRSWVNTIEDGYLTLAFEAKWGSSDRPHYINLETTAEPYRFTLKHDCNGDDDPFLFVSSLVAFDLHGLLPDGQDEADVNIDYKGYLESKTITFHYKDGKFSGPFGKGAYDLQSTAQDAGKISIE